MEKEANALCGSIIDNLLNGSNFNFNDPEQAQTVTGTTAWRKRSSENVDVSRFKYPKLQEDESMVKKIRSLENELKVLTGNLKFVSDERDHLRLVAEERRKDMNFLATQNYELNLANVEMTRMLETQNKECLELINLLVEMIWTTTSCSDPCDNLRFSQMSKFLKFGSDLVKQVLEDCHTSSKATSAESQLLTSFVGCLVNLSSKKHTLALLLDQEEVSSLLAMLVELMDRSQDPKLVHLQLMFIFNILNADHQFKANPEILSAETRGKLHNIAIKWTKMKGKDGLLEVVDNLQISLGYRKGKTSEP